MQHTRGLVQAGDDDDDDEVTGQRANCFYASMFRTQGTCLMLKTATAHATLNTIDMQPRQLQLHVGLVQNWIGNRSLLGSGRPRGPWRRWAAKPPAFLEGLQGLRAAQTPKITDFRPLKQIKIP